MKPKRPLKSMRDKDAPPKVRRAPGSPTKSQLLAAAQAETRALVARWKILIPVAKTTWSKLDPIDLARVEGRLHVLAGLVQRYYQVGRLEADHQVKAFFDAHLAVPAPKPVVVAAPSVVVAAAV